LGIQSRHKIGVGDRTLSEDNNVNIIFTNDARDDVL